MNFDLRPIFTISTKLEKDKHNILYDQFKKILAEAHCCNEHRRLNCAKTLPAGNQTRIIKSASHKPKEASKMHPFILQHQSAIAELCRRYHVQRLEVFGSAARGTDFAPESSDADFLVEFSPSADNPTLKAFFGLQAELSQILGRTVDLAEASALRNPYVQASINQSREVVYAA